MHGPYPERDLHTRPTPQQSTPSTPYARGTRLLRFCWLLLGSGIVLVFGFGLFTILVKGPNPPATAPAEQTMVRNESDVPPPKVEDNRVEDRLVDEANPTTNNPRGHADEVERVLGKSFHPSHREEDAPSLPDAPPLPPPPVKTSPTIPSPAPAPLPAPADTKQTIPSPSFEPKAKDAPQPPSPSNVSAAIEQRLQASEDDLLNQLLAVPELRLFSDLVVEDFRQREQNDERTKRGVPRDQIEFAYNMQLNKYMRQNGLKEGLPLLSGANCQLDPNTASIVQTLSKQLRDMGFVSLPGTPARGHVRVRAMKTGTPPEKIEAFKQWCDVNSVEQFRGALATLLQMLQVEDAQTRLLLVRELAKAKSSAATAVLAKRAMVDLSPEVRQAAVAELGKRPSVQYVNVLLKGLRYPWPPVADHAALALRQLKPTGAVPTLVGLLDRPNPVLPFPDNRTKKPVVREMVRLNHMRHCLLCHAPSANTKDGLVRGLVPTPGQPLPRLYYASQSGNFVRADITFLRQDFSDNLPVEGATPWPKEQRFDFVTRVRPAKPEEMKEIVSKPGNYPQREAVLYALRGITGKDGGDIAEDWRKTLGFDVRAVEKKKDAALDKTIPPPKD